MTPLAVGAGRTVNVLAEAYWNPSGVQLERDARYEFMVPPGQTWRDDGITSGPDGYTRWYMAPFFWLRRGARQPWFALIGTIDKKHRFLIGAGTTLVAPIAGELFCYANDAPLFYRNNHGRLELSVTRTA